jgi:lipoic acid synthetase
MEQTLSSVRKPQWLNKKINLEDCNKVKALLNGLELNTVCREASCPNIGECFAKGEATVLILGKICSRNCSFCGVQKGNPEGIDLDEPSRVREAVNRLDLKHVVITSVTRDDLSDGGADIFVRTIQEIRSLKKSVTIEVLIPDFQLNLAAIKTLVEARPDIIGHNMETVPRLYTLAHQGADYSRSLEVLRLIKRFDKIVYSKSGIMLGMGEAEEEVLKVLADLRKVDCDFLSIGQYLSPSNKHFSVKEYISPDKFAYYKDKALELGFKYVASGPYVRSSYLASEYISHVSV